MVQATRQATRQAEPPNGAGVARGCGSSARPAPSAASGTALYSKAPLARTARGATRANSRCASGTGWPFPTGMTPPPCQPRPPAQPASLTNHLLARSSSASSNGSRSSTRSGPRRGFPSYRSPIRRPRACFVRTTVAVGSTSCSFATQPFVTLRERQKRSRRNWPRPAHRGRPISARARAASRFRRSVDSPRCCSPLRRPRSQVQAPPADRNAQRAWRCWQPGDLWTTGWLPRT